MAPGWTSWGPHLTNIPAIDYEGHERVLAKQEMQERRRGELNVRELVRRCEQDAGWQPAVATLA